MRRGLLAVLLLVVAGACSADGDDAASEETTTTVASEETTTTAASEETTTTAASEETTTTAASTGAVPRLPAAECCVGVSIDAGRYLLPARFAPLTTVDVPDGWTIVNEASARYLAFGRGSNEIGTPSQLVMLLTGPAADHANLANDISSSPELEIRADSTSTASGTVSRTLDAIARPNPDFTGAPAADIAAGTQRLTALGPLVASSFGLTTSTPDARLRFVIRQEGELLLVAMIEAPVPEFDAFSAAAEELLAGLAL